MNTEKYIHEKIAQGPMHVTLLDPEKINGTNAAEVAMKMKEAGTDLFFIGGSTGVNRENVTEVSTAIQKATGLPVVLFGGAPDSISPNLDAVLFMSIMNALDVRFVTLGQVMAAPIIAKMNVESIPMGYIIVEPGMKVAKVSSAKVVPQDKPEEAMAYALASQMFGMRLVYLEAGSGADRQVPPEMIKAVKSILKVPLIVGGGMRTPEAVTKAREAGADIIVTGTFIETCSDADKLKAIVNAAKGL